MRLLVPLLLIASVGVARADDGDGHDDGNRRVAVLEYRAGSSALPGIEARVGELLRRKTSLTVIDSDEARQGYGGKLDSDIVGCAGEAACIGRIGKKLDAREVLLVGVSEFGDVILTLQRIDVQTRDVTMRIAEALAEDAAPTDDELTGYLKRVMPESDFLRYGTIRVSANLAGAKVFLGDEPQGVTPIEEIVVRAPATYELKLTKSGYVSFSAQVQVPPDGEVAVDARLTVVGGSRPWYAHWYVAAIAAVIVGGGVGLGVYLAQEDPTTVPVGGELD